VSVYETLAGPFIDFYYEWDRDIYWPVWCVMLTTVLDQFANPSFDSCLSTRITCVVEIDRLSIYYDDERGVSPKRVIGTDDLPFDDDMVFRTALKKLNIVREVIVKHELYGILCPELFVFKRPGSLEQFVLKYDVLVAGAHQEKVNLRELEKSANLAFRRALD